MRLKSTEFYCLFCRSRCRFFLVHVTSDGLRLALLFMSLVAYTSVSQQQQRRRPSCRAHHRQWWKRIKLAQQRHEVRAIRMQFRIVSSCVVCDNFPPTFSWQCQHTHTHTRSRANSNHIAKKDDRWADKGRPAHATRPWNSHNAPRSQPCCTLAICVLCAMNRVRCALCNLHRQNWDVVDADDVETKWTNQTCLFSVAFV